VQIEQPIDGKLLNDSKCTFLQPDLVELSKLQSLDQFSVLPKRKANANGGIYVQFAPNEHFPNFEGKLNGKREDVPPFSSKIQALEEGVPKFFSKVQASEYNRQIFRSTGLNI
jgi:hypothetical protein